MLHFDDGKCPPTSAGLDVVGHPLSPRFRKLMIPFCQPMNPADYQDSGRLDLPMTLLSTHH